MKFCLRQPIHIRAVEVRELVDAAVGVPVDRPGHHAAEVRRIGAVLDVAAGGAYRGDVPHLGNGTQYHKIIDFIGNK